MTVDVRFRGKTGSEWHTIEVTRLTDAVEKVGFFDLFALIPTGSGFCRRRNQFRDVFRAIPVGSSHAEQDCVLDRHSACAGQITAERQIFCQFCGAP
jgi:hypothetical protein